jgi:flagellar L-ring protein precursor FlgH
MMRPALISFVALCLATPAGADDLYDAQAFAAIAGDQRARAVGDVLTIVVYQSAEARNAAQNASRTRRDFEGSISGGTIDESGSLSLNGGYTGQGEVRRSESFVTQISVVVQNVLDNGDLLVAGEQSMHINGETTLVRVQGRVRPSDIMHGNQVLSPRLADARISYDGQGFVSRNARPNIVHRILSILGLGG